MGIMEKKMETTIMSYMGGCQKYGPFLGPVNIRCRIIIGIQKGTIILTTTQMIGSINIAKWGAHTWVINTKCPA